jgi:hypothetical protein
LLGENVNTTKRNTEDVFYAGKDVGLLVEANAEETKYIFTSYRQDVGKIIALGLPVDALKMWQRFIILERP